MTRAKAVRAVPKILANILLYTFIVVCVFSLIVSVISKQSGEDAATVFGYQIRVVISPSMEKCEQTDVSNFDIKDIPTRSLIFVETVPEDPQEATVWYADLQIGDVLTFKYVYNTQETITHRIVDKKEKPEGGYMIYLEGDNKNADAATLRQNIDTSLSDSPNYIIGKVVGQSYPLGLLIYALKSPVGIVCIVMVPCAIIIILEVMRIVSVLGADKKEKQRKEQEEQQNEIEALKKQLEALQQNMSSPSSQGEENKDNNQEEQEN